MLARRRLAARPWRLVLGAAGIAIAVAALAILAVSGRIAETQSVRRAVDALPAGERTVAIVYGSTPDDLRGTDASARRALAALGAFGAADRPRRLVLFQVRSVGGLDVQLSALDGLDRSVTVLSGRLPRSCTTTRCETVVTGPEVPRTDRNWPFVVVGRVAMRDPVPFGGPFRPATTRLGSSQPLLLGADVAAFASLPVLLSSTRTYGWIAPLPPAAVTPWSGPRLLRALRVQAATLATGSTPFSVAAPADEIQAALTRGAVADRRIQALGAIAVALLVSFLIMAARAIGTDLAAERRRLSVHGGRRSQQAALVSLECGAIAIAGVAAGLGVGLAVDAVAAAAAGLPVGELLDRALLQSPRFGLALVALALIAFSLLVAGQSRLRAGRNLDLAAVVAVGAVVLLARRGAASEATLASGTDPLLVATPLVAALATGLVIVRATPVAAFLVERACRRRGPLLRLAAIRIVREPARTALPAAFLAVATGLALFATLYAATLRRGERDQAAFTAPVTEIVGTEATDPYVIRHEPGAIAALRRATRVDAVLRRDATVGSGSVTPTRGTILGVDAGLISHLIRLRTGAAASPSALDRALTSLPAPTDRSVRLPRSATRLVLPARAAGDPVELSAVVEDGSGVATRLAFGRVTGRALSAAIPPELRGGRLVAIELTPPEAAATRAQHQANEDGTNALVGTGTLTLGELGSDAGAVTTVAGWLGRDGATVAAGSRAAAVGVDYNLTTGTPSRIRPRQGTDGATIPVAVTPDVAASAGPGGSLQVTFGNGGFDARIVSVIRRFPTLDGPVLVVDRRYLAQALDALTPGSGSVDELWLSSPAGGDAALAAALDRGAFAGLGRVSHAAVARDTESDPLARGTLGVLAGLAAVAVALALVGLGLTRREESVDADRSLQRLELAGASPARVGHLIRARLGLAALFGLAGGVLLAGVLATVTVRLVRLGASAQSAEPPLLLSFPGAAVALVGGVLLLGLVAVAATPRSREPR